MATNQGFKSLIPDATKALPGYLYHWLRSNSSYLQTLGNGATFKELSKATVARIAVPLPPISEQKRIVEVLDRSQTTEVLRREAISRVDELAQSIFIDMFGDPTSNPDRWTSSTIGQIAEHVTDGEHLTPKRETGGIKLLSARNVRDGYIDFEAVDYIGQEEYQRISRRCCPRRGDILISCSGTIGRVAPVETDEPFSLVRSVALVRPMTSVVTTNYLATYLRTPALAARMSREARSSSQANLFQGPIRALPVLCPPLNLQIEFGQRLQQVAQLKAVHLAHLTKLEQLQASLQYHAFQGTL